MEITEDQVKQIKRTMARNEVLDLKVSLMHNIANSIGDYYLDEISTKEKERLLYTFWQGVDRSFISFGIENPLEYINEKENEDELRRQGREIRKAE